MPSIPLSALGNQLSAAPVHDEQDQDQATQGPAHSETAGKGRRGQEEEPEMLQKQKHKQVKHKVAVVTSIGGKSPLHVFKAG